MSRWTDISWRRVLERFRQVPATETARYRRWYAQQRPHEPRCPGLASPRISIITPVFNTDPRWLRACIGSVQRQVYPHWELCLADDGSTSAETLRVLDEQTDPRIRVVRFEKNAGISEASNGALALATGDYVALLDHDDELTPDALVLVAEHLNAYPETDVVYSDEDKLDEDGGYSEPFFKPDWSPEHLLSAMYACHMLVARRSLVAQLGGFRKGFEGAQDHDLMLRLSEVTSRIHHLPRVLYHWRRTPQSTASSGAAKPWADDAGRRAVQSHLDRTGQKADVISGGVPGLYRARFEISDHPLVSLIVVGTNQPPRSRYPHIEVLSAARQSISVNAACASARGVYLLFVDAGLDVVNDDWVESLLEYAQQTSIGAVGARIEYADGRLRHLGLLLGVGDGIARAMDGKAPPTFGYFSSAIGVRNYSAVSAECLMTRREVFDRIGGFDESLPWSVADVDYCVRARDLGLRSVFTPYAVLRRRHDADSESGPSSVDVATLRRKWGQRLDNDPYYNPNLSRRSGLYLIGSSAD